MNNEMQINFNARSISLGSFLVDIYTLSNIKKSINNREESMTDSGIFIEEVNYNNDSTKTINKPNTTIL